MKILQCNIVTCNIQLVILQCNIFLQYFYQYYNVIFSCKKLKRISEFLLKNVNNAECLNVK